MGSCAPCPTASTPPSPRAAPISAVANDSAWPSRGPSYAVTRDSTVLIVAQRVSTIRDADLILVMEDGLVVGRGTHDQLLEDCPTYQEIVASQLSAEEAA